MGRLIPFKFRLGEIILFTISLKLQVIKLTFHELKSLAAGYDQPLAQIEADCEGVFVQSLPVPEVLPTLQLKHSFIRYIPNQYRRFFINLETTAEHYLKKFSPKSRSTLKRKIKKFKQYSEGVIDWREYQTPAELSEYYPLARDVSANSYQEKLFDAGLPKSEKFQQQMQEMAEKNQVKAYLLFHKNKAIAYLYLPISGSSLLYQHLGFLNDYSKWSPGTVLQWLVLEKLFAEKKYKLFDFTGGEGAHKEFFATGYEYCADIYFLKSSFKNMVTIFAHFVMGQLSKGLIQTLDLLGLKNKIKKIIRLKSL